MRKHSTRLKDPSFIANAIILTRYNTATIPNAGDGILAKRTDAMKTRKNIEVMVPQRDPKNFDAGLSAWRL